MKKLVVVSLVVLVAGAMLVSPASAMEMKVGAKLGFNFASMTGAEASDYYIDESKLGVGIGATVDLGLSDMLAIQTGLVYNMKGGQGSEAGVDVTLTLDYLEIPVLAKFNLADGKAYALAGLSLDMTMTAKVDFDPDPMDMSEDVKDDVTAMDMCLVVGGGAALLDGKMTVGLEYSMGLATVDDTSAEDDLKTSALSVTVGYLF